ncbi:DUF1877 family protein [Actinoallomurus sp. NPDC050550]|uniref:DUF1877 family protein n=1 Tax=Actinoallomurus sp. NPDC050550 TaxID=3154937 RepID=UPI0033EC063E
MRVAMTYLRLPEAEGAGDPGTRARAVFGGGNWREKHPVLPVAGAWQALHYLLTGDPWDGPHPAADVVCGGRLLTEDGAEELGVDVIYLTAERVKLAADHLAATEFASISGRYDAERMAELGVQGADDWVGEPAEAIRDGELRVVYERLTRFFEAASAEGQAVFKAMG